MEHFRNRIAASEPSIRKIFELSGSKALSLGVLHQNEILYTAHYGASQEDQSTPPNDETIYRVGSLTKVMTACAVSYLVDEGILGWDIPVRHYLPKFAERNDECGAKATLRDLLCNRTGLAVADHIWGQARGKFLLPKDEIVRTATYLEAVKPFRERFIYSAWNWGLATEVVEAVTGNTLGTFMKENLFDPLKMTRTTLGTTEEFDNVATGFAIHTDGSGIEIPFQEANDGQGLAGGYAGKSCIRDLLLFYKILLRSMKHQVNNSTDSTPSSPLKHLNPIFTPHIGIGESSYCLGLFKTTLPGALGISSLNATYLGYKNIFKTGQNAPGLEIWHHAGNLPGFLASKFLIPSTDSAIVVLCNSLPFLDPTDLVGQLLIGALIEENTTSQLLGTANLARKTILASYPRMISYLEKNKTCSPPMSPLSVYEGRYWNAAENFCLTISVDGKDRLLMRVQDLELNVFKLEPYDGNTFYWPPDRDDEVCNQGMWPEPRPEWHKISFHADSTGRVVALIWHHDAFGTPETFSKKPAKTRWQTRL